MPFWSIARKDIRTIMRDKSGAIMFFILPLVFLFVFGAAFGGRSQGENKSPFKILVSNMDRGKRGGEVLRAMQQVNLTTTETAAGAQAVEQQVGKGDYAIGVILPPDFSAQLEAYVKTAAEGSQPPVPTQMRVLIDPAQPQVTGMAKGAIFASVQRVMGPLYREAALARVTAAFREMAAKNMTAQSGNSVMPFQMSGEATGNAQADTAKGAKGATGESTTGRTGAVKRDQITAGDVITPGFAVYFVFFLANSVAVSLLLERQEGTLRRMLSAPIARSQILLGKLVARGILGILQTLLLFGVAGLFLHTHYGNSLLGIALVALATIFTATGLGLLIATFAKTPEQIQSTTTLLLLIMGAISGCLMPRMFLPDSVQKFSLITPHAWALNAYQDLMLRGRSLPEVLPNILAVIGFGVVFYILALTRFRFE